MANTIHLQVIQGNIITSRWLSIHMHEFKKANLEEFAEKAGNILHKNKSKFQFVEHFIVVSKTIIIGAEGDLLSAPGHKTVSGKHCKLSKRKDGWYIEDLQSTNGTFLERNRAIHDLTKTGPLKLKEHDVIHFGRHGSLQIDVLEIHGNYKDSTPPPLPPTLQPRIEPQEGDITLPSKGIRRPVKPRKKKEDSKLIKWLKKHFWHD